MNKLGSLGWVNRNSNVLKRDFGAHQPRCAVRRLSSKVQSRQSTWSQREGPSFGYTFFFFWSKILPISTEKRIFKATLHWLQCSARVQLQAELSVSGLQPKLRLLTREPFRPVVSILFGSDPSNGSADPRSVNLNLITRTLVLLDSAPLLTAGQGS